MMIVIMHNSCTFEHSKRRCLCNDSLPTKLTNHKTDMQATNCYSTKNPDNHINQSINQQSYDMKPNQIKSPKTLTPRNPTPTPSGACPPSTTRSRQTRSKAQGKSAFPLSPRDTRSRRDLAFRRHSEVWNRRLPAPSTKKSRNKWEDSPKNPTIAKPCCRDVGIAKS
jgi:hypothetical protein